MTKPRAMVLIEQPAFTVDADVTALVVTDACVPSPYEIVVTIPLTRNTVAALKAVLDAFEWPAS